MWVHPHCTNHALTALHCVVKKDQRMENDVQYNAVRCMMFTLFDCAFEMDGKTEMNVLFCSVGCAFCNS